MSELLIEVEDEIEFLDEDAEIVQQCVQNVENESNITETDSKPQLVDTPLLVERVQEKQDKSRRKRKKDDDDSDYDPREDMAQIQSSKKRRQLVRQSITRGRRFEFVPKPDNIIKDLIIYPKIDLVSRRKLNLRVPDYEDPLCLPVRALRKENLEQRKLKNWNNLCLEHFKNCDSLLRVDKQPTVSSKRIVVLRNLHNSVTGKVETTMYSKLTVENKNGERKSEVVQSVLPKYREKKHLNYRLAESKKYKPFSIKNEVILTKEVHKDLESLVVYKPAESMSLVYKMFDNDVVQTGHEEEKRKCLKEVASCKICAPCYQTSWRAFKDTSNKKIYCHVCKRPCVSMYNLLAHLKSHTSADVQAHKNNIARSLATTVEYHYKCRICQEQFLSIKNLRLHVRTHKGTELFKCEVCSKSSF